MKRKESFFKTSEAVSKFSYAWSLIFDVAAALAGSFLQFVFSMSYAAGGLLVSILK
jgi:hypothetical protein